MPEPQNHYRMAEEALEKADEIIQTSDTERSEKWLAYHMDRAYVHALLALYPDRAPLTSLGRVPNTFPAWKKN
jgi:hypothetical protein